MWVALSSRRRYVRLLVRAANLVYPDPGVRYGSFVHPSASSSRRFLALGLLSGRVDVYGESPAGVASDGDGGGGFCCGAGLISRRQAAPVFLLDVVDLGLRI